MDGDGNERESIDVNLANREMQYLKMDTIQIKERTIQNMGRWKGKKDKKGKTKMKKGIGDGKNEIESLSK